MKTERDEMITFVIVKTPESTNLTRFKRILGWWLLHFYQFVARSTLNFVSSLWSIFAITSSRIDYTGRGRARIAPFHIVESAMSYYSNG